MLTPSLSLFNKYMKKNNMYSHIVEIYHLQEITYKHIEGGNLSHGLQYFAQF